MVVRIAVRTWQPEALVFYAPKILEFLDVLESLTLLSAMITLPLFDHPPR